MSNIELRGHHQGAFGRFLARARPRGGAEQRIVAGALARMSRQGRRRLLVARGLAVTAAAAVLLGLLWFVRSGDVWPGTASDEVSRQQQTSSLAIPSKKLWTAPSRQASFTLGSHRARLSIGARVQVEQNAPSARLRVKKGKAKFQVEPLQARESFMVLTRHLRAEVVGTHFSVALVDRCSSISVTHGEVKVVVKATGEEHRLTAGAERTYCESSSLADGLGKGGQMVRKALVLLSSGKDLDQAVQLLARYLELTPDGPFAEEALFHLVFARQRQGKGKQALELAKEFLRRFPKAPRAERIRTWLEKSRP